MPETPTVETVGMPPAIIACVMVPDWVVTTILSERPPGSGYSTLSTTTVVKMRSPSILSCATTRLLARSDMRETEVTMMASWSNPVAAAIASVYRVASKDSRAMPPTSRAKSIW